MWFWKKWVGGKPDKGIIQRLENINAVKRGMGHREILATFKCCWHCVPLQQSSQPFVQWLFHPLWCHYSKRDWISGQVPHVMYTHCVPYGEGIDGCVNVAFQTDEIPAKLLYCPSVIFQKRKPLLCLFCSLVNILFPCSTIPPFLRCSLFASSWLSQCNVRLGILLRVRGSAERDQWFEHKQTKFLLSGLLGIIRRKRRTGNVA